jgi:hypothetical protein
MVQVLRRGWRRVRTSRALTALLGPRHRRSRSRIELDITWACDLRCHNCNRSCSQAPTGEGMSAAQVRAFVDQSLARGQRWERIRILGGEPTLHPELDAILAELARYRAACPQTRVELATHGHGERVRAVLARLPAWVAVDDSHKVDRAPAFEPFNDAPVDRGVRSDFRNGCPVTEVCGVGLGPRGYYACAVAGAIDRVVGYGAGRPTLPDPEDEMVDQLDSFCRLCGHFDGAGRPRVTGPTMSPTWERAYAQWRARGR